MFKICHAQTFAEKALKKKYSFGLLFSSWWKKMYSANNYHYGRIRFVITRFIFACEGRTEKKIVI